VSDVANLEFVRSVVGKARIASAAIVFRTANGFPLAEDSKKALPSGRFFSVADC
jgi:hypothetical protein